MKKIMKIALFFVVLSFAGMSGACVSTSEDVQVTSSVDIDIFEVYKKYFDLIERL